MHPVVSALATLALIVSTGIVVILSAGTHGFTRRTPPGPDAMGIVAFFLACLIGWGLTLVAAMLVAGGGGFGWMMGSAAGAVLLLVVVIAGLAFLGVLSVGVSLENRLRSRTLIGWLGGAAVPLATNIYLLALAWADPEAVAEAAWPRLGAAGLGLATTGAVVIAGVLFARAQARAAEQLAGRAAEDRRMQEECLRDRERRNREHLAALEALPDDAPLRAFLTHLFIDKTPEHHALAIARIGALPGLGERLGAALADPDPMEREYALNFLRMGDAVEPGLAEAVSRAVAGAFDLLAADITREAASPGRSDRLRVLGLTRGLLLSAERLPGRFEDGARALRDALAGVAGESAARAITLVDRYLEGGSIAEAG